MVLHGISAAKIVLILYINYLIATALPRRYVPACTWTFNVGILFANELCRGYPLANVVGFLLPPTDVDAPVAGLKALATHLDSYAGLIPRWEVLFNITVLRLISFNFDHLWSLDHRAVSPIEVCKLTPHVGAVLMHFRRRTSILLISLKMIVYEYLPKLQTSLSATTLHMYYIHLYTSPVPSSTSTTTFPNNPINFHR